MEHKRLTKIGVNASFNLPKEKYISAGFLHKDSHFTHIRNKIISRWKKVEKEKSINSPSIEEMKSLEERHTPITLILVLISLRERDDMFIAEIDGNIDNSKLINDFKDKHDNGNLELGTFVPQNHFRGFDKYKISKRIDKLTEQYNEFRKLTIEKVSKEIIITNKDISQRENTIYIPQVYIPHLDGLDVTTDFNLIKEKSSKYMAIILDEEKVKAEYLALLFQSDMGKLFLKMASSGLAIPSICKRDIEQLELPIPNRDLQIKLIDTREKMEILKIKISEFEREISLNPKSVNEISIDLNSMLESLELLNRADKIRSLIRKGENKKLEFKQTLRKNIHTGKKDKRMEKAVLKTIVAFLNTNGGVLLVGVKDNGEIFGVENDFFKNKDKYKRHFHNLIRDQIGEGFYPKIDYYLVEINDNMVLYVDCKSSTKPCYLEDEEFYVRVNPATERLSGRKALEYIETHFGGE